MRCSFAFSLAVTLVVLEPSRALADGPGKDAAAAGTLPADSRGRPLDLGFEAGTLEGWKAEGTAFSAQPIDGDAIGRRRGDMKSGHAGRFWVGSFESAGDGPQGTLTSVPFRATRPFASFLVGGGSRPSTCVEIVRADTGQVVFRASGDDREELERVVVDLSPHLGQEVMIRIVDGESGEWGHVNFDDFRLHDAKPDVPPRRRSAALDVYSNAGLGPVEAARAMTVPPGFSVSLFAGEPDVVQPIAMTIDDRGRVWVAEAYSYPRRVADKDAKDRILIFEDEDGDGRFDRRKVFAEHLNLVSGLEVGFGGAWVARPPTSYSFPTATATITPTAHHRSCSTAGASTIRTRRSIASSGAPTAGFTAVMASSPTRGSASRAQPDADRVPINAGIWRYHPTRHVFEVFAHGTSNPWGIDFDVRGQMIITACVIPHLYHMVQGGRYERQAGQHFNAYTYDDIKTIADHRHYLGANPHGGNGRSDSAGGGHAHAGAMIYLGGAWPAEYDGSLFMNNIHGARLNRDILKPSGSGFVGSHAPDFLLANDAWSQIVSLRCGPDGSLFLIDWYDKNQCHHNEVNGHDRTNGRIFKVAFGKPTPVKMDLAKLDNDALVQMQTSPNEWHARHARRILQERGSSEQVRRSLAELRAKFAGKPAVQLRILLALSAAGGLRDPGEIERNLADPEATIRAWSIQLATETGPPGRAVLSRFATLAGADPSPVVRLYLASALQRLPLTERWEILAGLAAHAEDATDCNLPLMYWYAAEPLAAVDASRGAKLGFIVANSADSRIYGAARSARWERPNRWPCLSRPWAARARHSA